MCSGVGVAGPACRHRVLAQNGAGQLSRCTGCGAISLHVGPVTLRVDAATAEALWALLGEGLHEVHEDEMGAVSPPRGRA